MKNKLEKLLMMAKEVNEMSKEYGVTIHLYTTNTLEATIFRIKTLDVIDSKSINFKEAEVDNIDKLIAFIKKYKEEIENV